VEVGKGRWHSDKIKEIREAKDRQAAGPAAPPYGLYLTDVIYPR
jgi:tRNA pseudouridine38-40 synthase